MKATLFRLIVLGLVLVGMATAGCTRAFEAVRLNQQAQVYIKHNRYETAKQLLRKSLEADFENPACHYWLGTCYEAEGDSERAINEYGLAVRFAPAMEIAQLSYITALHQSGQSDKSLDAASMFLENKDAATRDFLRLAQYFVDAEMPDHMLLACQAAAKDSPNDPGPWLFVADYYFEKNNKDRALRYLIKAFEADPIHPGLTRKLGEHGLRVDIPEPTYYPEPPSPIEQELREMQQ